MTLTQENYYGQQANWAYMSKSQFNSWQNCEAATLAELEGTYTRPASNALAVGSYVDAALDGPEAFAEFVKEHPEIFKKDGSPKADFVMAQDMVDRIKRDRLMSMLLTGAKQAILKGKIAGVPFRGKADCIVSPEQCRAIMKEFPETEEVLGSIFTEGCLVDLKTARDFSPVWSDEEGRKVSWIEHWGYVLQGAIYRELYRQMYGKTLPFIIVAVSKEAGNGITALYIPHEEMDAALRIVEENAPIYNEVKAGLREAIRCEDCEYCRRTRVLTGIRNYKEA